MLREATRPAHDRVDAAYGRYALNERAGYAAFLTAHARALPVAEARMAVLPFAATLPVRAPLVAADLSALGVAMPDPLASGARAEAGAQSLERRAGDPGLPRPRKHDQVEAAAWGTLYVVEGSRLGGAMLARQVPAEWPAAYLGAVHAPGAWRAIRAAIDAAGTGRDPDWRDAMVAGALATFDLYARAAE